MRILFAFMAIIFGVQSEAWTKALDYPELNVTPRASERIGLETNWEKTNSWNNAWPIAAAGLGTLVAAISAGDVIDTEKDPNEYSTSLGMGVGLLTMGIAGYMATQYRPYASDERKEDDADSARLMTSIGTLASLLPLFFSSRYETVHCEQMKYKKRIYAPVAYAPILTEPFSHRSATGIGLMYRF
jgi:hypothetical protein